MPLAEFCLDYLGLTEAHRSLLRGITELNFEDSRKQMRNPSKLRGMFKFPRITAVSRAASPLFTRRNQISSNGEEQGIKNHFAARGGPLCGKF